MHFRLYHLFSAHVHWLIGITQKKSFTGPHRSGFSCSREAEAPHGYDADLAVALLNIYRNHTERYRSMCIDGKLCNRRAVERSHRCRCVEDHWSMGSTVEPTVTLETRSFMTPSFPTPANRPEVVANAAIVQGGGGRTLPNLESSRKSVISHPTLMFSVNLTRESGL